ncbi:hypothetical protein N0V90_002629 [Kalmusia sp. IMI 367209]|nr:hypothetical protein N0V90_002629 [Kalmusia sp. IMI 367209]
MASETSSLSSLDRDSSVELGSCEFRTQYHRTTGRPIRRSAGKVKPRAGYVDSKVIEDECEEPIETPSEDEDGHIKPQQRRKRKRSPSPDPPPLDEMVRDGGPEELSDEEGPLQKRTLPAPIILQFNVPLGFHGPLMVKLDRSMLQQEVAGAARNMQPGRATKKIKAVDSEPQLQLLNGQKKPVGFTDLPPELRNKVYRHLFVTDEVLSFPCANHLCRTGQFLSTCRTVYSEGCSILYGENKFLFDRNMHTRGQFWESDPKEIGYKDIRQFLKMIGPENLAYLRDVSLVLEDARPATTPHLDHEQRRFLNDDHLIDVIRVLRQARLRKFTVTFYGRRALTRTDSRFINYLQQIKADEVVSSKPLARGIWYNYHAKIDSTLWRDMQESMTRKKKLYITEG